MVQLTFIKDFCAIMIILNCENDIKAGIVAGCKSILVNGVVSDYHDGGYVQINTLESVLEFVDRYIHR